MDRSDTNAGRETSASSSAAARPGLASWLAALLTCAVVACRLLTPTEGAVEGDSLWIAQLSLLIPLLTIFAAYRSATGLLRPGWIDAGVLLLVAGHAISAWVNSADNDARAAINLLWEWAGVAMVFFLLRDLVRCRTMRRSLILVVVSAGVTLSGLGLWQHFRGYTETWQHVQSLQSQWDELQRQGRPTDPREAAAWDDAVRKLRSEFARLEIPFERSSRVLWEQRLKSSTEPLGFFALANTFSGFLAAIFIVWLGVLAQAVRSGAPRWQIVVGTLALALLAYCLLLTKSRTAWAGLAAGLVVVGTAYWMSRTSRPERLARWIAGAVAALVLLGLIAGLTGGLDRLVLLESAKSLRYRTEYWSATWQMLSSRTRNWLAGVGPGNFRQHYLQFKLPQSSEEIADPHNLFLDVWSGGGLIGLAGLLLLIVGGSRAFRSSRQSAITRPDSSPAVRDPSKRIAWTDPVLVGGGLAFGIVFLADGGEGKLLFLWPVFLLVLAILSPLATTDLPAPIFGAAFVTLAVHLLGAGGIEMPAVLQIFLLLAVLGLADDQPAGPTWSFATPVSALIPAAAVLGLFLGCWFTATEPVMTRRSLQAIGRTALIERGQIDQSVRYLRQAAEADPQSDEPCLNLAEISLRRWLADPDPANAQWEQALYWYRRAIACNPHSFRGYRLLGAAWLERYAQTAAPADAREAADALTDAARLYPNHAALQSELAEAYWRAGDIAPAAVFAERALELDAINHQAGHIDKFLPEDRVDLMHHMESESSEGS